MENDVSRTYLIVARQLIYAASEDVTVPTHIRRGLQAMLALLDIITSLEKLS